MLPWCTSGQTIGSNMAILSFRGCSIGVQRIKRGHALVGADAEVCGDGVEDVVVARGLLPDVQPHHAQTKALHL